jgi:O-antigen/teichoic acid export membrane protein
MPLALGIISFNKFIISIWTGVDQYGGDLMSYAIACYVVIEVVNHVNAMIVVVSGKMRWWATISAIQSILGIVLAVVLGKFIGLEGIMLGLVISSVPMLIFLFQRTLPTVNMSFIHIWNAILFPLLLSSIPLVLFVSLLKIGNFSSSGGLTSIYQILAFLIIWVLSTYFLAVNREERLWIFSLLKISRG